VARVTVDNSSVQAIYDVKLNIPVNKREKDLAKTSLKEWLPINCDRHQSLLSLVNSGEYDGKEGVLFNDLRADVSLLLHCLRTILGDAELRPKDKKPEDLLTSFDNLVISDYQRLLEINYSEITNHQLSATLKPQARMLRQAVIAATAAGVMTARAGISPSFSVSLSLLRYLPLLLLAWNFPSAYARAQDQQGEGFGGIIFNLERVLNISMIEYSFAIFKGLKLNDFICSLALEGILTGAQGLPPSFKPLDLRKKNSANDVRNEVRFVEHCLRSCQLGEAIARLSEPQYYPVAGEEWKIIEAEVVSNLGRHGLTLLNQKTEEMCSCYLESFPEIFSRDINPEREIETAKYFFNIHRFNRATAGLVIEKSIKESFYEAYRLMGYNEASKPALNYIFKHLLLNIGYQRGCVFVYNEVDQILTPILSFGSDPWGYKTPISISVSGDIPRLIFHSLESSDIVKLDRVYQDLGEVYSSAGSFGNVGGNRGVLYLEYTGDDKQDLSQRTWKTYFLAAMQTVKDAINF
jgi:hypothetical protein